MKQCFVILFISIFPFLLFAESTDTENLYKKIFPNKECSWECFRLGLLGYGILNKEGYTHNDKYLTLIDFTKTKLQKRLFLIDVKEEVLVLSSVVSHGKNSEDPRGENYPPRFFSNKIDKTYKSSLGFYLTGCTYSAERNGDNTSMCLYGLDKLYNSNACFRSVIMHYGFSLDHQKEYVTESRAGNAWGCPALPKNINSKVIELIKGGSVLFIYSAYESSFEKKSSVLSRDFPIEITTRRRDLFDKRCNCNK